MKNTLPHLINLPPFVYRGLSVENYGLIRKIFFVIYGKIISLTINLTEKKIFCFLINLFFRDTKVVYSSGNAASCALLSAIWFSIWLICLILLIDEMNNSLADFTSPSLIAVDN